MLTGVVVAMIVYEVIAAVVDPDGRSFPAIGI